jgi:superfamily II DNA helicase RecQ
MEDAEFEKDGQAIKFRKVRLTEAGREVRSGTGLELLINDGIVEEFAARGADRPRANKAARGGSKAGVANAGGKLALESEPVRLSPAEEALAARIREWRAGEAKRLRVPAYVVMHDRTLAALAQARPKNLRELLLIDGIGPAKAERFGAEILRLCAEN